MNRSLWMGSLGVILSALGWHVQPTPGHVVVASTRSSWRAATAAVSVTTPSRNVSVSMIVSP